MSTCLKDYLQTEECVDAFYRVCRKYKHYLIDQIEDLIEDMKYHNGDWKFQINIPERIYRTGNKYYFTWHTVHYGFKLNEEYEERDYEYWEDLGICPPFVEVQNKYLTYGLYITDDTISQKYPIIGVSTTRPHNYEMENWHGYNNFDDEMEDKMESEMVDGDKYQTYLEENSDYSEEIDSDEEEEDENEDENDYEKEDEDTYGDGYNPKCRVNVTKYFIKSCLMFIVLFGMYFVIIYSIMNSKYNQPLKRFTDNTYFNYTPTPLPLTFEQEPSEQMITFPLYRLYVNYTPFGNKTNLLNYTCVTEK